MKRFLALVLFFLFAGGQAFAQATPYYFKHYDINSRLSHNTVTSIFQDSRGFIWIGTKNASTASTAMISRFSSAAIRPAT